MAIRDVIRGNAPVNLAGGMPTVQTVDAATVTTLLTVEVPDKFAGVLEVAIMACQDGGTYNAIMFWAMVRRDGVNATLVNQLVCDISGNSVLLYNFGACNVTPGVTGSTFRCQVTGELAHTYRWFGAARWVVLGQYHA
jgi:hypothetical protein